MAKQYNLKYVPVEAVKDKNIFVEEFYSAVDCDIFINNVKCDYINSISYSVQEQLSPLYGYASYLFDDVAQGNRIVVGSMKIPVGNYSKVIEDFTLRFNNGGNGGSGSNGGIGGKSIKDSEETPDIPSWVSYDKPLTRNMYVSAIKSIYEEGHIINNSNIRNAKVEVVDTTDASRYEAAPRNVDYTRVENKKPKYDLGTETFFKGTYSNENFHSELLKGNLRKNFTDIRIQIGGTNKIKTLVSVVFRSLDTAVDADGDAIYEVIQFIARDLKESGDA